MSAYESLWLCFCRPKKKARSAPAPGSFRHALTVFSCPMFYLVAYSYIAFIFAFECYISLLVDFATDKGISFSRAITMLSISSVADLVGRLTLPLAADRGYIGRQTLLTVSFLCLGSLFVLLPMASSYVTVFAFATAIAFCIGVAICLFSVLLAEYVGIERVSMAYGMVSGFSGVTSLFKPLIIGYFRDVVGAYDKLFIICGSAVILGGLIWIAVRLVETTKRSRRWNLGDCERKISVQAPSVLPKYICNATELPAAYSL
nr:monocarboxylate transporter 9-like [Dermacentor andersoni]